MPLSLLHDFNSLGIPVNLNIDVVNEFFFLLADKDSAIESLHLVSSNGLVLQDGVGAGNGYAIINIYNIGRNFEKQILIASFSTFIDDAFPQSVNAWVMTSMDAIENKIGEKEILKFSLIAVQSGLPKVSVDLEQVMFISNLEPL